MRRRVRLRVEGAEHLTRVATNWPDELGGPIEPAVVVGAPCLFSNRVIRWIPPLEGRVVAEQLVRLLADIQPSSVTSDATCALPHLLSLGRRALLIWLTDVMDAEVARERTSLLDALRAQSVPALALSMRTLALGVVQRYLDARYDAHW